MERPPRKSNGNDGQKPGTSKGAKRAKPPSRNYRFPTATVEILKQWLYEHRFNAYPAEIEKVALSRQTSLTIPQINNWFINARRRYLPGIMSKDGHDFIDYTISSRRKLLQSANRVVPAPPRRREVEQASASISEQLQEGPPRRRSPRLNQREVEQASATISEQIQQAPPRRRSPRLNQMEVEQASASISEQLQEAPPRRRSPRLNQMEVQQASASVDVSEPLQQGHAIGFMVPENVTEEGMLIGRTETVTHTGEIDLVTIGDQRPRRVLLRTSLDRSNGGRPTSSRRRTFD